MKIPGGYILLSRKIIESEIMDKPSDYLKVWIYLLNEANHKPRKGFKRGQGFTSIDQLREVLSYKIGYRTITPSRKKVWRILDWLRRPNEGDNEGDANVPMMETVKETRGIRFNICNYNTYQNPNNYEGNSECPNEGDNEGDANVPEREYYTQECKNVKNGNSNIAARIVEFAVELGLPKPRTPGSLQKTIGVVNARLKDTWDPEDLKAHLQRYLLKRQVHERYLKKYKVPPEIKSAIWCPNVDWKIWEILSPQRLDTYFEIWKKENFTTVDDLISAYRSGRPAETVSRDWDIGKQDGEPGIKMTVAEAEAHYKRALDRMNSLELSLEDQSDMSKVKEFEKKKAALGQAAEEAFFLLAAVKKTQEES